MISAILVPELLDWHITEELIQFILFKVWKGPLKLIRDFCIMCLLLLYFSNYYYIMWDLEQKAKLLDEPSVSKVKR